MVVVDALALALDGTRTVAAYSLSGEMTSLISISYLAAGAGMGWAGDVAGQDTDLTYAVAMITIFYRW